MSDICFAVVPVVPSHKWVRLYPSDNVARCARWPKCREMRFGRGFSGATVNSARHAKKVKR